MCVNCNDSLQVNLPPSVPGPVGATGAAGPSNTLIIGTVTGGAAASATITGASPNQTLNLVLPSGSNGTNGVDGEITFNYVFGGYSAGTSNPSNGKISFNGANSSATTFMSVSTTDNTSTSVANIINLIGTSTNPSLKALIKITKKGSSNIYSVFQVTGRIINAGYILYNVTHLSSSATAITAGDNITFGFSLVGDKGDTGAAGTFNFPGIAAGAGVQSLVFNNGGTTAANYSIVAGTTNSVGSEATDSLVAGTSNSVNLSTTTGSTGGLLVGGSGHVISDYANYSLVVGKDVKATAPSSIYLGTTKFVNAGDNQTQFMQLTGARSGTGDIDLVPTNSSFANTTAIKMLNNSIWNVEALVSVIDITAPTKYAVYKFTFGAICTSNTVALIQNSSYSIVGAASPTAATLSQIGSGGTGGTITACASSGSPAVTLSLLSSAAADNRLRIYGTVSSGTDSYRWSGNLRIVQLGWF